MTDRYQETLAAYKDLGSIYSFGYGAMRQRYQLFHDNLCEAEDLMDGMEKIISAVEFRSAEVIASRMLAEEQLLKDCGHQPYVPIPAETSAIYQAPAGADGIARDQ
jgi:hypothetical protein